MLKLSTIPRCVFFLMILTAQLHAYGQGDIFFSGPGLGTYCAGSTIPITYDAHSIVFTAGNVLRVELSDATGNFSSPVPIGTLATEALTGTIAVTLPVNASGTAYRVRIVSSHPSFVGSDNGKILAIKQPPIATPTVTIFGPPTVCSGVSTEFTATPSNGGTVPSYQWKKNGTNVGTNTPSYIDNALTSGDAILCVMTSNRECVTTPTSNSNTLHVTVAPNVAPTISITADPSTTVGPGTVIYLSSSITAGGTAPGYEWKKNGVVISTSNAFTVSDLNDGDVIKATLTSNEMCVNPTTATSNEVHVSIDNTQTRSGHSWEFRASQPDGANTIARSNASGFSIGSKGYVGVGYVMVGPAITSRKDFWEYDPTTDVWTQKADFAGAARYNAASFSMGTKGYIGTGMSATGTKKDFWQYDPATNLWAQRADIPGPAREQAFGMAIGTKGYIGGGFTNGQGDFKDFYEFDPATNTWQARADFGGGKRMGAAAFSIESKGFVAGGYSSSTDTWYKDLWDFDPVANLWTKRADMPGNGRTRATAFTMAGSGYVGLGNSKNGYEGQFFQYSPSANSWTWKPYYPGPGGGNQGNAMTIGNRSFVYKDGRWVEYSLLTMSSFSAKLCSTEGTTINWDASGFTFGPGNTFTAQISSQANFSVTTMLGTTPSSAARGAINAVVPSSVSSGNYYVRVISTNPVISTLTERVNITELPPNHLISVETGATVCKDVPTSFKSNLTGAGFQWYRNNDPVGTDSPTYVESTLSTGDVIKSVRSYTDGCKAPVAMASNSISMTVNAPPKPVVSLNANVLQSTPAVTYQWYLNGTGIAGANRRTYQMIKDGVYKVRTSDNAGCFAFSDELANVYVGLEGELNGEQIAIYPNPAVDEMTLQLADDLVAKGCRYSVVNELGQTVVELKPAERTNRITLTGRSSGLYMVRLSLDGETIVRRIVKVE